MLAAGVQFHSSKLCIILAYLMACSQIGTVRLFYVAKMEKFSRNCEFLLFKFLKVKIN